MSDFQHWEKVLTLIFSTGIGLEIVRYLTTRKSRQRDTVRQERLDLLGELRAIQSGLRADLERKEQEIIRLREENWKLRDELQTLYLRIEEK